MSPVRVLLVDDHPIVLQGMRQLLARTRFAIAGEATSGAEALALARSAAPDVVVLDLRLPDCLAPDLCRWLRRAGVGARLVVLTGFEDDELLQACLAEGVAAILLKDAHDLDVPRVLERVLAGETVLDHRLSTRLEPCLPVRPEYSHGLTGREYEALRLMASGLTSAEIARELFLSVNTVRSYAQSLLLKLDAHTRIEAVAKARRLRLI